MSKEQKIEKKIMSLIHKMSEARNRLLRLHVEMVECQTQTTFLIEDLKNFVGADGVDSIFDMVIDQSNLEQMDIMIVFEYTEQQYRDALKRHFERKKQK